MADAKVDPDKELKVLKDMIAKARERPINFGIALGKDEPAFFMHPARQPEQLRKEAKARTKGAKGTHGQAELDGKRMILTCLEEPPTVLFRAMKTYMKDRKLGYRLVFRGVDGKVYDEDAEEAGGAGGAAGDGVEDGAASPAQELYEGLLETIPGDLQGLRASDPAAAKKIEKVVAAGRTLAETGQDYEKALTYLDKAAQAIARAQGAGAAQAAADAIPEGKVAAMIEMVELSQTNWREVRFRSMEGLDELMTELRGSEDRDLHLIADKIQLVAKDMPESLEALLGKLSKAVKARDAGLVGALKTQAQGELKNCAGYLKSFDKEISRCERNPLGVTVKIRQPMAESLKEISANLRAV